MLTDLSGTPLDESLSGFLFWGLPIGKIAADIVARVGGKKSAWESIIPTMHKAYDLAVKSQGYPPFRVGDRGTYQTATRVQVLSAFDLATVTAFLTSLESLATQGEIDPKYWTPAIVKATGFDLAAKVKGVYSSTRTLAILAVAGLALFYGGPLLRRLSGGKK
jgi:uncharacterized membrane protein YuzA (DUF378 family)